MQKILIVEDDTNINNLLQEALSKEGYSCEQAFSGTEAKLLLNMLKHGYALVLLDLMLPGIPGEAVLEEIRKKGNLPVIVLTAKDSLDEKVEVLTSGADDYITKPFNILEVKARIKAIMRRTSKRKEPAGGPVLIKGSLKIDCESRRVFIGEREINLTAKEFDVLELLAMNPNKVYSRENLLNLIWGYDYPGDARTVDVHIRRLREKIEQNPSEPKYVHTKWGVGYYFQG